MENNKKLEIEAKKYKGESSVVSSRLPVVLVKMIDDICVKSGRNRNEIVLMCLEFALDNLVIKGEE